MPSDNPILCWCKQLCRDDVARVARECLTDRDSRQAFIEALGFHIGKTCGYCSEFPGIFTSIAEGTGAEWQGSSNEPLDETLNQMQPDVGD